MNIFNWIAASIVIVTLIYVSFVLTLADWFKALRRGEAVTLLPERGGRKWPLWTQVVIIIIGMGLCIPLFYFGWIPLFHVPSNITFTLGLIGLLLYLFGLIFMLWARRTLGKYWGLSTSTNVKLLDDHQLIQSGPFAFIRHPMYFGAWVLFLGLTLLYPVWAIFILFLSALIAFSGRARREEAALAERFGNSWVEYRKRTKLIIPFIY
ncbi:MAG: isoprenylcysteine carboxylmethyltransferase family protein [Anaerolineales bacterium]|nr:isoprenylcysteine carboxylmethyltransferase family protein [Anaerolineales bacterium]